MYWYQYTCLKSLLLNTKTSLLNLIEYFNFFNTEAIPSFKLLDNFSDHISFYPYNYSSFSSCKSYLKSLDHLCLKASFFFSTLIFITDISTISSRNIHVSGVVHTNSGSLQNGLKDEQTCGIILALAYMLCRLSAAWSQLQMMGRSLRWEWVLIGVSPLNTRDQVQ